MTQEIADYQLSAWLMAACCNPLNIEETIALTQAYVQSGKILDLSQITRTTVDKHSTGGVGDKATLIVAPILAACGLGVAKLSGRGLGLSGGTIDKLESIPGFQTQISTEQFIEQVDKIGLAIASQTKDLAPADGRTYALRDVTATVANLPLIAASVMSKKIAAGASLITLDVKYGTGAFMPTRQEAQALADWCIKIGNHFRRNTLAHLSDMNQPLGYAVGNALEVEEAIECLKNNWPADLKKLCDTLCEDTLVAAKYCNTIDEAKALINKVITKGKALESLGQVINAQGGNADVVESPQKILAQAQNKKIIETPTSGTLKKCDAHEIAKAAFELGAGRHLKTDTIDPAVGIKVLKKVGDKITQGEPLFEIHYNNKGLDEALVCCNQAIEIN